MRAASVNLYDLTREELRLRLVRWDLNPFHTARLWNYLYLQLADSFDAMPELPARVRARLRADARLGVLPTALATDSCDGFTRKYLLTLADSHRVETVLMRFTGRVTACLSSQVGCAMGCVFCATGQMGYTRHLTPGEIVAQAVHVARALRAAREPHRLRNVVLMGMGEPLHNYEAVMQAVRLARYHTKRSHVVRFCGAYHGWWGDVQPGIGNPVTEKDTFTLAELGAATLRVLRHRNDIACVLVNPLQALHPNAAAPSDSSLLDSGRKAGYSKHEYTAWLQALRKICSEKNIALIFDEVFVGFRLAPGGAQDYFGVQADMVTYGKTLGGGLPIGVLCGKKSWMKRFREQAPGDICFARGTFNSHPYVMGAMNAFLQRLDHREVQALYANLDETWNNRAQRLNHRLAEAKVPVQVANLSSIWTVLYTQPACYNWLFQHYLRLEGLALSWVGTGRIIFSLNYTEQDFEIVVTRFVQAAQNMQRDGWWWNDASLTNKAIKRRILTELIRAKLQPSRL